MAIGGGVSNIGEPLIEAIRRHTADHVFISAKDRYKIVQSKLGDDVVLVGALLWAVHMDKKLDHSTEMTAAK